MTKKHFIALAKILKDVKPVSSLSVDEKHQWEIDVCSIAAVCASFNRAFDANKFYRACGRL